MSFGVLGKLLCRMRNLWPWIAALTLLFAALPACAEDAYISAAGPTFTLTPPKGVWTLIAYGDTRFTNPLDIWVSNPPARRALVARIAQEKPDVLLMSGDLPYNGSVAKDYDVYREETAAWKAEGLKVFPTVGNHELHGSHGIENWWTAFPELKGRRWYSVQFGEAYILALDSDLELTPGSVQSTWVASQLEALPRQTRYVFVLLHHPPVADPILHDPSHSVRSNENALAQQLEAAAKRLTAKIVVVSGHIHAYERFERGGVVYLVSGGGGAKQYRVERSPSDLYQDNVFPNFHYMKFVSEAGALKETTYRLDDKGAFVPSDSFVVNAAAMSAGK
jgi:hypothetical protein